MKNLLPSFCTFLILISCKQEPKPQKPNPVRRKSPIAITSITDKQSNTYMKIVYGQPYKRGRKIFGGLVPYNKIWRTGANEATELTTTKPVVFNGKELEKGTYSLFSIPNKNKWTIVLNDSLGQWGAFDYNKAYDHLRTNVTPERAEQETEAFTIQFTKIKNNATSIEIRWDTTQVFIPVQFVATENH